MWNKAPAQPSQTHTSQVQPPKITAPIADTSAVAGRKTESDEGRVAAVGRSIVVKGEITGSEDLTVDGQMEGRIDLPEHMLTVGPNASIQADITAKAVTIFGKVTGTVTVKDKIDVRKSGSVEGNVTCARITVQEGAYLCGRMEARGEGRSGYNKAASSSIDAHAMAPVA
jgi:cytoskeletal protein CcmA (bactofilin family)